MFRWFGSFRLRLAAFLGALSLLMGAGIAFYVDQAASVRIMNARSEALRNIARSVAYALAENLREREREIVLLAQSPLLVRGALDGDVLRQRLAQIKRSYRHYAWLGVADSDGVVRSAPGGLLEGESVVRQPWFQQGLHGPWIGDVRDAVLLVDKLKPPPGGVRLRFLDFVAPILAPDGKTRGVVGAHVHWSAIDDMVRGALPPEAQQDGVEVVVIRRDGEVFYPLAAAGSFTVPEHLSADAVVVAWPGQGEWLVSSVPVGVVVRGEPDWRVVLRQPLASASAPVHELNRQLCWLVLAATIVLMLAAYALAARFGRSLEQLAMVARRIRGGDDTGAFAVAPGSDELGNLSAALQDMKGTLDAGLKALAEKNAALEREVAERASELAELYDRSPVGYHSIGPDGSILRMNDRELQWLGYRREEVVGRHFRELLPDEGETLFAASLARIRAGEAASPLDLQLVRKDGSLLAVRVSMSGVFDDQGNFVLTRTAVMDVTEQRQLETGLRSQEALNRAIIHGSSNGLLLYDEDGQCLLANQAAAEILGTTVDSLLAQNFHHLSLWPASGCYDDALKALAGERTRRLVSASSTSGKAVDCLVTMAPLHHEARRMVLVVMKDVSELVAANRELEKLARYDALTSLFNRLAANERLRDEFLRMKRTGLMYALLLLDVDHFKRINDTFGHETGDEALKHVAALLRASARATDFVARFGGEEFLVVLPDTGEAGARIVAEKIRKAIAGKDVPLVGKITVSVGIAVVVAADGNEDEALRRADRALYRAKAGGRDRVVG